MFSSGISSGTWFVCLATARLRPSKGSKDTSAQIISSFRQSFQVACLLRGGVVAVLSQILEGTPFDPTMLEAPCKPGFWSTSSLPSQRLPRQDDVHLPLDGMTNQSVERFESGGSTVAFHRCSVGLRACGVDAPIAATNAADGAPPIQ